MTNYKLKNTPPMRMKNDATLKGLNEYLHKKKGEYLKHIIFVKPFLNDGIKGTINLRMAIGYIMNYENN